MTDAVLAKAKKILDSNADFSSAIQNYVELVANELKVQWVGLWQVDKTESYLKLTAYWYSASMTQIETFERDSQLRVHTAGEGMPGKAWRSCALFSSSHLIRDMMLPKSIYASNAGLHSGTNSINLKWKIVKATRNKGRQ